MSNGGSTAAICADIAAGPTVPAVGIGRSTEAASDVTSTACINTRTNDGFIDTLTHVRTTAAISNDAIHAVRLRLGYSAGRLKISTG
jgi:hypothetical protein